MSNQKLPECYNSRVYFQPKGKEKRYLKTFGDGENNTPKLEYTDNVEEAKLFRSHIGWVGPGPDFDCHHVAMSFLRTFFTMDGAYRIAKGSENFDDEIEHTNFVTESLEGQPRISYVLIPVES
ncbi:hypothetical protein D3C76_25820 [compost metagenome]